MKRALLFLLFAGTLAMTSCNTAKQLDKISIDGLEDVVINGITSSRIGLDFHVAVSNFSNKNLEMQSGVIDGFIKDKKLYTIRIKEPVKVPKHTQGVMVVPVVVEFSTPLGIMGFIPYMSRQDEMLLTGEFVFKAGAMRRKYREEGVSLRALLGDSDFDIFQELLGQLGSGGF